MEDAFTRNRVVVSNTEGREDAIFEEVKIARARNFFPPSQASRVKGRLGFTTSQCFGRAGRFGVALLNKREYVDKPPHTFDENMESFNLWLRTFFANSPPRVCQLLPPEEKPAILFTDGWQSALGFDAQLGCGAVLFSPRLSVPQYFGFMLPQSLATRWLKDSENLMAITNAELIPSLIARSTWQDCFKHARIIHFIDNNGCRDALIKGSSKRAEAGTIVGASWLMDSKLSSYS